MNEQINMCTASRSPTVLTRNIQPSHTRLRGLKCQNIDLGSWFLRPVVISTHAASQKGLRTGRWTSLATMARSALVSSASAGLGSPCPPPPPEHETGSGKTSASANRISAATMREHTSDKPADARGGFDKPADARGGFDEPADARGGFDEPADARGGFEPLAPTWAKALCGGIRGWSPNAISTSVVQ